MFTSENGDQPDARNIGIVLTDGKSNNEQETWKVNGVFHDLHLLQLRWQRKTRL